MVYTEIKEKNGKKYYYRVKSIRDGKKFKKNRIYLGKDLSKKEFLLKKNKADGELNVETKEERKKKEKKIKNNVNKIKSKIIKILKKNKVVKAGIFGSYALGEEKKNSDVDILIEPPKGIGFGFAGIAFELEEKLDKKVDLVSYNGLSPYLRDKILNQEVRII